MTYCTACDDHPVYLYRLSDGKSYRRCAVCAPLFERRLVINAPSCTWTREPIAHEVAA